MLSNNLLIPYGFVGSLENTSQEKNNKRILNSRKIAIFSLIILSYFIYRFFVLDYSLVSIGLVSFVVIALAPAFFGALFWKEDLKRCCNRNYSWFCCLLFTPYYYALGITSSSNTFIQEGPWGLEVLRPLHLLD
jgi:Na+/proline symporter